MLAAVSEADVCRTSVPEGVRDEELRRRRYVTKGVGRRGATAAVTGLVAAVCM